MAFDYNAYDDFISKRYGFSSPSQAVPQPAPPEQGFFGDFTDAIQRGFQQALGGDAETVYQLTGSSLAGDAAFAMNNAADSQLQQMSALGREAMNKELIHEDQDGNLHIGDGMTDWRTWALQTGALLGQVGAIVGTGFGVGTGIKLGAKEATKLTAKALGDSVAETVAREAAKKGLSQRAATTLGMTAATAAMAGGMRAEQGRQEVMQTPIESLRSNETFNGILNELAQQEDAFGVDPAELELRARDVMGERVAADAFRNPAAIAADIASGALGGALGGFVGGVLPQIGRTAAGRAVQGALIEGGTEAVQGGLTQRAVNVAMAGQGADPERGEWDKVLSTSLSEGLLTGPLGGFGGLLHKPRPPADTGNPTLDREIDDTERSLAEMFNITPTGTTATLGHTQRIGPFTSTPKGGALTPEGIEGEWLGPDDQDGGGGGGGLMADNWQLRNDPRLPAPEAPRLTGPSPALPRLTGPSTAEPGTWDYDEEQDGWAAEAWEAFEAQEARNANAAESLANATSQARTPATGATHGQAAPVAAPNTGEAQAGIRRGPQSPTNQTPQESAKYDRWMLVIDSIEDGAVYTDPISGDTYTARVIEQGIDKRGKQRGKSVSLLDGNGVPAFDLASNGEAGKDAGYFGASIEGLNGPAWTFETKGNTERDGKAQPVGAQAAPATTLPRWTDRAAESLANAASQMPAPVASEVNAAVQAFVASTPDATIEQVKNVAVQAVRENTPPTQERSQALTAVRGSLSAAAEQAQSSTSKEPDAAPAQAANVIEHTTRKGKTLRGVVRTDLTKDEAKAVDPYTFQKDGGWFIREREMGKLPPVKATPQTTAPDTAPAATSYQQAGSPIVLQNRDRSTPAMIDQMNQIAASPDYLRTGTSRTMDQGAPVVFGDTPASAVMGREEVITDNRGDRIKTRYAVVEAADLIPSNSADGTTHPRYATGQAGKLRALAGNGRAAGLIEAYRRRTTGAYRAELEQDAAALGVDPAKISAMRSPVLVRVMDEADVTPDAGDRSNVAAGATLSPIEQAANDARRIDVATLDFDANGTPTDAAVRKFIATMPVGERGNMLNPDGTPTRQIIDRMMAAAFKAAYGNDELVRLYAQATDPEARAVMNALGAAAGEMAQLAGTGDYDLRDAVAQAGIIAVNAARKGRKMVDEVANADLMLNPDAFVFAQFMADNIRSGAKMAAGLRKVAALARKQVETRATNAIQSGLFGGAPTLTRAEVLGALTEMSNAEQKSKQSTGDLWSAGPSAEQVAEQPTAGRERQAATGAGREATGSANDQGREGKARPEVSPTGAAQAIDLKGKRRGDMLIASDGTLSRIEGIDDKTGRIRTTRNPDMLSERSVLIDQDTFDRLVRETESVRMEAAKGQPAAAAAPEAGTKAKDAGQARREIEKSKAATDPRVAQLNRLKGEMNALADRADKAGDLELAGRLRALYGTVKPVEADVVFRDLTKNEVDTILRTNLVYVTTAERKAEARRSNAKDRPKYGENNKLVSQARREEIRALMRKKALNLNSGVDPELMALGAELAVFHIEAGTRKFADFAKAMIEDIGEKFTPFLRSFYDAARSYPGLNTEGMTPYEETVKQHAAMLTPEVREAAAEVVGTVAEKPKARSKKTGAKGDMVLTQDWGVEHIDGYGHGSDREAGNDTKDAFLKESRNYLNAVADALRAFGFEPHLDRKGKPEKPVSVNEAGMAVSGDVSLVMRNEDNGNNVYITIRGSAIRGIVPSTPSGISVMYRVGPGTDRYASKAGNTWAPVDLSANDLAALVGRSGQFSSGAKAQAGANDKPVSSGAGRTLEGKNDAGRNAASDDQSLGTVPPSGFPEAGQGVVETSDGLRPSDEAGDGRFEEDRTRRGNRLGGSPEPVLSGAAAEAGATSLGQLNPKADAPNKLAGENPGNFRITEDFGLGEGTTGKKIEANLQAIRTLRKLQSENRYPTRDEQAIMARYVGWGGLKSVFDPKKADASDMYGRAQRELRQLLDKDEYSDAFDSVRNAHYTAKGVVDAMWRLARHMGFNGGRALEPTVGSGNFIGLQPEDMANSTEWHASELDYTTGLLAKSLYPDANVLEGTGFQEARFAQGVFDLAIGNPPFGSQTISSKMKGYSHLNGMKVHNFIIAKTGIHLRPGGVMAMVVTHRFLDTANDEARSVLAKDFKFLGAIRLPNDAFRQNAGTDVVTDIVILQKYREGEVREKAPAWLDVNGSIEVEGKKIRVNKYFEKNPGHILGRSAMDGSLYAGRRDENGEGEYTVHGDGRDVGKAIDEIIATSMADLSGVLEKTDQDADLEAAMLQSSDIPIGGLRLSEGGIIERRDMDDAFGNAVIEVIGPETLWKDEAREWEAVRDAVVELRDKAKLRRLTEGDFAELVEQSRFAFKADGTQKADPSKAMAALYDLVNAAAKPEMFTWEHDQALAEIEASLSRRKLGQKGYEALRDMLDLRNRTLALIHAELSDSKKLDAMRGSLNAAYDKFVAKHGFLSDPKNFSLLGGDVGAEAGLEASFEPEISAAVSKSSGIPKRKASAKKADILSKRVNFPRKEITSADSAEDAMDISLSERGKVDLAFMAGLLNKPAADVIAELSGGSNPRLFRNPETDTYEDAESYLSGNVRHKLEAAKAAGLKANVKALEAVQPKPKTKSQVKPSIRGLWMPEAVFADFLSAMGVRSPEIMAIHQQGILKAFGTVGELTEFGSQFSHPDRNVIDLFNAAASGKSVTIMRSNGDVSFKDEEATKAANAIVARMAKVFETFAYSDDSRSESIVAAFNERMNTHAPRTYNGEKYLRTVGANPSIQLRRTQKNGAWRMVLAKTMLGDHVVGAGKTYTAIAGVMERRRLGLSRKPMIAAPNHIVVQWARDFYKMYPGAKVLAATPADFAKKNRRRLMARIATGDYDAVIVGHTSIGFIENFEADHRAIIDENIEALETAMEQAREAGESKRTLTQMRDRIAKYKGKLEELSERTTDEIGIDFKALGIDYLVVDEAHEFKNLEYATGGERVVGMNDPNGSKRAFDLYVKVRGLLSRDGGVTFLTGTPVSNSLVEIYTMMRYLAHDELLLRQQEHFDAWSGAYAATETKLEYTATQKLKPRRVLAGLNNLSALRQIYEHFADIITMRDLKRIYSEEKAEKNRLTGENESTVFPIPKVEGGKRRLDVGEITEAQSEYMDYLVARMKIIESKKGKEAKDYAKIDNALNVLTDARKMSLDIRIVDPTAPRDENGKVMRAARSIKEIYDKWDHVRGTQMVFCDLSTPAKTAAKGARNLIKETAEALFGKDQAKQVRRRLDGKTYQEQWSWLREQADELIENENLSQDKRDSIEAYFAELEDADAIVLTADIGFSVYDDMRAVLVEQGIPESEIAFIHDYNTPEQKEKLFDRMNSGYVRVLMGSSAKMGAGTNAQKRLVALHHMDAPWRPSDVEQRDGRIIRQGNLFYQAVDMQDMRELPPDIISATPRLREEYPNGFEVKITPYSTNGTSDAVMWQVLERKAAGIEQFRNGGLDSVEEDSSDSDQYSEFMATSTGNPIFRYKLEAERAYTELEAEVSGVRTSKANAEQFLSTLPRKLREADEDIEAFDGKVAAAASYGGQSGTAAEYRAAMQDATAEYEVKYAEWLEKSEEATKEIQHWEKQPESTRGAKPSTPTRPPRPSLTSKQVQANSGYARAVSAALAAVRPGAPVVKLDVGEGLTVELSARSGETVTYYRAVLVSGKGPSRISLDDVMLGKDSKATDSPKLARAIEPDSIEQAIAFMVRSRKEQISNLNKRKPAQEKLASVPLDESRVTAARELMEWYQIQVRFAEERAEVARSKRPNRYIPRDRRRFSSWSSSDAKMEDPAPYEIEVDGQKYNATGYKAGNRIEAFRASDGLPVVIRALFDSSGKQDGFGVIEMPESLRDEYARNIEELNRLADGLNKDGRHNQPRNADGTYARMPPAFSRLDAGSDRLFSKFNRFAAPGTAVKGMARPQAEQAIAQFLREYSGAAGVRVNVVAKQSDVRGLPSKADEVVRAFYSDGEVTVVLENIANSAQMKSILRHEVLAHHGLRSIVNDADYKTIIQAVLNSEKAKGSLAEVWRAVRANYDGTSDAVLAEEVIAHVAENTDQTGLGLYWERVTGLITRALRAIGLLPKGEISRTEIRELIRSIGEGMKQGVGRDGDGGQKRSSLMSADKQASKVVGSFTKTERAYGGRAAYDRAKAAGKTKLNYHQWVQVRTPEFKAWFGDWESDPANASKVTDPETGEPMVVYHGGGSEFEGLRAGGRFDGGIFATEGVASGYRSATYPIFVKAEMLELGDMRRLLSDNRGETALARETGLSPDDDVFDMVVNALTDGSHYPDSNEVWDVIGAIDEADAQIEIQKLRGRIANALGFEAVRVPDEFDGRTIMITGAAQIKSATGNNGDFDPSNPDIRFSRSRAAAAVDAALEGKWQKIGDWMAGKWDDLTPAMLGALTLRQLADIGGKLLPGIKDYLNTVHQMSADRNERAEAAGKFSRQIHEWARKNGAMANKLFDLMHEATIAGVDPSLPFVRLDMKQAKAAIDRHRDQLANATTAAERTRAQAKIDNLNQMMAAESGREAEHERLRKMWEPLNDEARAHYVEIRDTYQRQFKEMHATLKERIEQSVTDGKMRRAMIDELHDTMTWAQVQAPYFPLARFGEYFIEARDSKGERIFEMFDSAGEQRARAREMAKEGLEVVNSGAKIDKMPGLTGASAAFVNDLTKALGDADMNDSARSQLTDQIYQMYLRALPDRAIRKAFIHRKKTKGYSNDAVRALASSSVRHAYQLSRLKHAPTLEAHLGSVLDEARTKGNMAAAMANELQKRHQWVMAPTNSKLANQLTGIGFIWMLGVSPAAALVNLTQNLVVAMPVLASKHGWAAAGREMARAGKEFLHGAKGGGWDAWSIEKRLSGDELAAYREMRRAGTIDNTNAHDLMGLAEGDTSEYGDKWYRAMNFVSALFHKAEVANREITGMAAYRLARKRGLGHEAAISYASDSVWDSHFDYSNANRARYMQKDWQKVALQFKQYGTNMMYYLWRNAYQSLRGADADTRRTALTQLLGTLGMTSVLGGAMALPIGLVFGMANLAAKAWGDDDEPWDAEAEFRQWVLGVAGEDLGRILLGGVIPGIDLTSRIDLNGLLIREPDRELDGEDVWAHYAKQAAGPVLGGVVLNWMQGAGKIADGNIYRGVEQMVPKFIKDGMKAGRYATEGALNTRGAEIVGADDFNAAELILQASGFTPSKLADTYDQRNAMKNYEQHILNRRSELLAAYYLAWREGDSDKTSKLLAEVQGFNKSWPQLAITGKTVRQSITGHLRYQRENVYGTTINKRLRAELEGRFAE